MNWVEPEIIFNHSQNAVVIVGRGNFLRLHHGAEEYCVDSFRSVISLRLVESNDDQRSLQLFVFRNPCLIVEVEPCREKNAKPVRRLLQPFLRIGSRVMTVVVKIWTVKYIFR